MFCCFSYGSGGVPLVEREVQPIGYRSSSSSSFRTNSTSILGGVTKQFGVANPVRIVEPAAERPFAVEVASPQGTVELVRKKGKAIVVPSKRKV